jgi:hypothetical protein
MKLTIRLINDNTSMALINKKSLGDRYDEILDKISRHDKLYDLEESTVNIKCKINGSVYDMEDIIKEINKL